MWRTPGEFEPPVGPVRQGIGAFRRAWRPIIRAMRTCRANLSRTSRTPAITKPPMPGSTACSVPIPNGMPARKRCSAIFTRAISSSRADTASWPSYWPTGSSGTRNSDQPYSQYVTALIRSNQANQAETLVGQWLREGQVPGELPPAAAARLTAAISSHSARDTIFNTNHVEERWQAPLARRPVFSPATINISPRPNTISPGLAIPID